MRHRRRVARFFSTDDDNDDDGDDDDDDDDSFRIPILSVRSELGGDRQYLLPRPSAYSSPIVHSFYRANEESQNTQATLADPWIFLCRAWAIAITLHRCRASRIHLRQISISNKNLRTKYQRDVDSAEFMKDPVVTLRDPSRPIWLRTFVSSIS